VAIDEVTDWEIVGRDNTSPHPTAPVGATPGRISLTFQEMMGAIARWGSTLGGEEGPGGFGAGRIKNTTRITGTSTISVLDYVLFCNTDAGAYTVTLPAGNQGQEYRVINSGSSGNILTLAPDGAEHLLGENSSFLLSDAEVMIITFDESDGWY
jgi:hypothetical protein